jgi:serine/threonine protein kinase
MNIEQLCKEVLQYQQGTKKMRGLKSRFNLQPEQYFLLHNIVKACVDYNNYITFPHKYFISNETPTSDKIKSCLCNVENYTKVGEGWYAEAYMIDEPYFTPLSTKSCNLNNLPNTKSSKSSKSSKYLIKIEHLTRGDIVPFANLQELTKIIKKRYDTLEIAKKAGEFGIGPKIFDGYECKINKQVHFITIMEYVDGETYLKFYQTHKDNKDIINQVIKDIQSKITKLNTNYILHKDVHGENIIVTKKGNKYVPIIIDYGNAMYAQDNNLPTIDDPKDPNKSIDTHFALIDKLVFKLLDDKILALER